MATTTSVTSSIIVSTGVVTGVLTGVVTAIGFTTISPLASVAVKVLLLVLVVVVVPVVVQSDVGFTGPVPETELELVADVVAVESVVPAEESLRVDVMADETLDDPE